MSRIKVEQLVLVRGKAKKIALLLHPFDRRSLGANALTVLNEACLILIVVGLVPHGVPSGILAEVDVPRRLHALPDSDRGAMVALLGGSNELVIRAVQPLDHGLEARHIALHQFAWGKLLLCSRLQHLDAMLIGSGEEQDVMAIKPHEPRYGIGRNRLIGMTDVRWPIGIRNGGG